MPHIPKIPCEIPSKDITLLVGPSGSGKKNIIRCLLHQSQHGRVYILVPDYLHQQRYKAYTREVRQTRVSQIPTLANLLIEQQGMTLTLMNEAAKVMLLRSILHDLVAQGQLPFSGAVIEKHGFLSTLHTIIAQAQDYCVAPSLLREANITPYDAELGIVYEAYITARDQLGLADETCLLTTAQHLLDTTSDILQDPALLVIDGFDQLSLLQLQFLTSLINHVPRTIFTLNGDHIHRIAHHRYNRTFAQLVEQLNPIIKFSDIGCPCQKDATPDEIPHPLTFLSEHLFELDQPDPIDASDVVFCIEAADRERETRAILRRVRNLLRDGVVPEEIAILLRDSSIYAPLLREIAYEYHLPLALYDGVSLKEAPSMVMLLTMLRLPVEQYPRHSLVEVWRGIADGRIVPVSFAVFATDDHIPSRFDFEQAASTLDILVRHVGAVGGVAHIRSILEYAVEHSSTSPDAYADNEDEEDNSASPMRKATYAAQTLALFNAFEVWMKPLEKATMDEFVAWIRERVVLVPSELANTEDQESSMSDAGEDAPVEPDTSNIAQSSSPLPLHHALPMARFSQILDDLTKAATMLQSPTSSYRTFLNELENAVSTTRYGRQDPKKGFVAVLPVLAARSMKFDHVLIAGMGEGEFPQTLSTLPLYSRRERKLLAQKGVILPPPDPADEHSLFYEAITRARCTLTLSRTYLDERGNPLPPSPFLKSLLALIRPDTVTHVHIAAGSTPKVDEAASPTEMLVALAEQREEHHTMQDHASSLTNIDFCPTTLLMAHVQRSRDIEKKREGVGDFTIFEGMLQDSHLSTMLSSHFGTEYEWSVTQFNNYLTCPFRFAAAHVLNLVPRNEAEASLEHTARGIIYHDILAKAGKEWIQHGYSLAEDQEQEVLEILEQVANTVLDEAPEQHKFTPGAFWEWEKADIRRRLKQAIRNALYEGGEWNEFRPIAVEQGFGKRSNKEPLRIATDAGTVFVAGRVDRVDEREKEGINELAVLDYKSSSTPRSLQETLNADDVQLAIYILAVEQCFRPGSQVNRAGFFHLGSGKFSPPLTETSRADVLNATIERIGKVVAAIREGCFPVQPRDRCPTSCQFAGICRLNLKKQHES